VGVKADTDMNISGMPCCFCVVVYTIPQDLVLGVKTSCARIRDPTKL
jgi:hypothetical protein